MQLHHNIFTHTRYSYFDAHDSPKGEWQIDVGSIGAELGEEMRYLRSSTGPRAQVRKLEVRGPIALDEWTARENYDYAVKRSVGYSTDEERVAVAIFYSVFRDAGDHYATLNENNKDRMRWCARAAIASLSAAPLPVDEPSLT